MKISETSRLIITEFNIEDAPFYLELSNSPNYIKYIGDKKLKTVKDAKNYLMDKTIKSYQDFGYGFYKIELKALHCKAIGACGFTKRNELEYADVGFAFLPEYEGKGFAYEASIEVMRLAKEVHKLKKLVAITVPYNVNSIKLLKKLGLIFEKKVNPFEDDEELLLFAKKL